MKNKLGQEVYYLECECTDPMHLLRIVYEPGQAGFDEDPSLYLDVQFPALPFYKRMWVALLYLFGAQRVWTDHCLTDESIVSLGKIVAKYRLVKALRRAMRVRKARKEAEHGKQETNRVDSSS